MSSNSNSNTSKNKYLLPKKTTNKKTLVLDLDETLVHSQFTEFSYPSDIIIKIEIKNETYNIHVLVRPGVKDFLEKMQKCFEIVIFTASISDYADLLLDIIDQQNCCPYRLFREHCTVVNSSFVKDLQKLGRELKDVVIVDNSPLSYIFHPNNGLPILSWFDDKNDKELYNIIPILEFLSDVYDVREYIPKFVINNQISYNNAMKIINEYNENKKEKKKVKNMNTSRSKKYEINIQIVQNNINNIMTESQKENLRNQLINNYANKNNENDKLKIIELSKNEIIYNITQNNTSNNFKKITHSNDKNKNKKFFNNNTEITELKANLQKNKNNDSQRLRKKTVRFISYNKNSISNNTHVKRNSNSNSIYSKKNLSETYNTSVNYDSNTKRYIKNNNINVFNSNPLTQKRKINNYLNNNKNCKLIVVLDSSDTNNNSLKSKKNFLFGKHTRKKTEFISSNTKKNDEQNIVNNFKKNPIVISHRKIKSVNEYSNLVHNIQKNITNTFETKTKQKNTIYKISPPKLKKIIAKGSIKEWSSMSNDINRYRTNRIKNIDIIKNNAVMNKTDLPNKTNYTYKNDNYLNKTKNMKSGDNLNKLKGHKKTLSLNFDMNVDKLIGTNGIKETRLKK